MQRDHLRNLFIQACGALKKELLKNSRRTRAMRRSRHHTQKTDDHGSIRDTVPISERPATATGIDGYDSLGELLTCTGTCVAMAGFGQRGMLEAYIVFAYASFSHNSTETHSLPVTGFRAGSVVMCR